LPHVSYAQHFSFEMELFIINDCATMTMVTAGPSPGFSSRGAKNQIEGPKTRRGQIFQIQYWM